MENNILGTNAVQPGKRPAIEARDLYFAYGKNQILKGIDLRIEKGKITTIMGANGCGKSTLFSLITGSLTPKKGNIFIEGKNIKNLSLREFAKRAAIVHQYNSAQGDITVKQLVSYGRTPYISFMSNDKEEDERMIAWAMDVTGITEFSEREISRLSGGQRQRVWIAMALAQGTKILFLDEPTTYLDIRYQIEILELVKKLNREFGMTVIMVLHDINQAINYSDAVAGLYNGRIQAFGDPREIITEELIEKLYGINLQVESIEERKFVLPYLQDCE